MTIRIVGTVAFLSVAVVNHANCQVVVLGSPYLSGCTQVGSGELAPTIRALGEPEIGNTGFGILGENLRFGYGNNTSPGFDPILLLGVCALNPLPSSSLGFPTCPSQAGGCFAYIDLGVPVATVFGVSGYIMPLVPLTGSYSAYAGSAAWSLPIGNIPSIVGSTVCAQVFFQPKVLIGAPPACIRVSNGLQITIVP